MSMEKIDKDEGARRLASGDLVPLTCPREAAVDLLTALYDQPALNPTLVGFALAVAEALQAANRNAKRAGKQPVWPRFTPDQMVAKLAGDAGIPSAMLKAVTEGDVKCPGCGEFHGPQGSNGEPDSAADQYVDEMEALLKGMPASATKH